MSTRKHFYLVIGVVLFFSGTLFPQFSTNDMRQHFEKSFVEPDLPEQFRQNAMPFALPHNEKLAQFNTGKKAHNSVKPELAKGMIPSAVVHFNDPNLEQAVRDALNQPTGEITDSTMATLFSLSAEGQGITDLTGLEYAVNLGEVFFTNNSISDISPLANASRLREIYMSNNDLRDIRILSNLTNLEELDLGVNQISDVSPIAGLTKLTSLNLYNNAIVNIAALAGLTNLVTLDLNRNQIVDISALSGLTQLEALRLWTNSVTRIDAISNMTHLTYLDLGTNQIADVSPLENLTNLIDLRIGYNQITDISALTRLTSLKALRIYNNHIVDISALAGMTNLEMLLGYYNQITDISALAGCSNLSICYLDYNHISHADAISGLTNLVILGLSGNTISNINLLNLHKLEGLDLEGNHLNDINFAGLTQLKHVFLNFNRITRINFSDLLSLELLFLNNNHLHEIQLSGLPKLKYITLDHNQLDDQNLPGLYQLDNLEQSWNNRLGNRYLDLRNNFGFTQGAIQSLANELPYIDYDHILWDSIEQINLTEKPAVLSVSDNQASIHWATNLPIICSINYTSENQYSSNTAPGHFRATTEWNKIFVSTTRQKEHQVSLTELNPASKYLYQIFYHIEDSTVVDSTAIYSFETPALTIEKILQLVGKPQADYIGDTEIILSCQTDEPVLGLCKLSKDSVVIETLTDPIDALSHTFTFTELLPGTAYQYQIGAADTTTGIQYFSALVYEVVTRKVEDTTPPIMVVGPHVAVDTSEAVISFSTDEGCQSYLSFTQAGLSTNREITDFLQEHQYLLTNLKPGHTYEYTITLTDMAGNSFFWQGDTPPLFVKANTISTPTGMGNSFITRNQPDKTPPVFVKIPEIIVITDSLAVLTWAADEPTRYRIVVRQTTGDLVGFFENQDFKYKSTAYITRLKPNNEYTAWVTISDLANNQSDHPVSIRFTTTAGEQIVPAQITSNLETFITRQYAVLTWSTDIACDSRARVDFDADPADGELFLNSELTRNHVLVLNNLAQNSEYHYQIAGYDLSEARVLEGEINTFMTGATNEVQNLQITQGPEISVDSTKTISINWKSNLLASSNVEYRRSDGSGDLIFISNQELTKAHTIIIPNLENFTEYSITVFSITLEMKRAEKKITYTTLIESGSNENPLKFQLYSNYPNPFNSTTSIKYELKTAGKVEIVIYNSLGQIVQTLLDEYRSAGQYTIHWNGENKNGKLVSSGLYFYKLKTDDFVSVKKMLFLK